MSCKILIENKSNNPLPEYKSLLASGMDIRAWMNNPITLEPFERVLIHTGIFLQIPEGYEVQVRSRSGLTLKKGLIVLNEPGTIDADYRGEVGVILYNSGKEPQIIEPGERIAQLVVAKVEHAELEEVEEIDKEATERGAGGFGHTGNL